MCMKLKLTQIIALFFFENGPYNARSQRVELKFEFRPKVATRIEKSGQKNIITIHKDIYTRKLVYFLIYN